MAREIVRMSTLDLVMGHACTPCLGIGMLPLSLLRLKRSDCGGRRVGDWKETAGSPTINCVDNSLIRAETPVKAFPCIRTSPRLPRHSREMGRKEP